MDRERLRKLEKLAMLEIAEEEREKMMSLVNADILSVKNLQEVDTEGLEPLTNPYAIELELQEDRVAASNIGELLGCSPQVAGGCFVVPKVLRE
ncbi:MAG: Asp-tRNA(Asn)/Glu-tRNA(Gln) amidotransferase subunit GatC [Rickettsiales bacterium]|jgi:aspartyl-tRNA(Asn)/glutamyl-tRNA(Gln) amidotransferase subunit C|nr:Asp-tRNA(Asn)/Glu-tRNA(Gln) amidotransferase subunit GatC [Rickettsiales bacterium]